MYQLHQNGMVQRLDDGAFIPPDPMNRDRRKYDDWLAAGNAPLPADPVPVEAPRIAKLLIVERLVAGGKAEAAQAALAGNAALALMWNAAPEMVPADRDDIRSFITAIGADPDVILAAP